MIQHFFLSIQDIALAVLVAAAPILASFLDHGRAAGTITLIPIKEHVFSHTRSDALVLIPIDKVLLILQLSH